MALSRIEFDAVWLTVRPTLLRVATRHAHAQEAEDLAQEAYLTAVGVLDRYLGGSDPCALTGWLCRIVTYLCLNSTRTTARRAHLLPSPCPDHDDSAIRLLDAADARIRALYTTRRREIWRLYRLGCSQVEMAEHLGVSHAAVNKHVRGIIEDLRAHAGDLIRRSDGYVSAEALFRDCSRVTLYQAPQRTGAGISGARLRRMR